MSSRQPCRTTGCRGSLPTGMPEGICRTCATGEVRAHTYANPDLAVALAALTECRYDLWGRRSPSSEFKHRGDGLELYDSLASLAALAHRAPYFYSALVPELRQALRAQGG